METEKIYSLITDLGNSLGKKIDDLAQEMRINYVTRDKCQSYSELNRLKNNESIDKKFEIMGTNFNKIVEDNQYKTLKLYKKATRAMIFCTALIFLSNPYLMPKLISYLESILK